MDNQRMIKWTLEVTNQEFNGRITELTEAMKLPLFSVYKVRQMETKPSEEQWNGEELIEE